MLWQNVCIGKAFLESILNIRVEKGDGTTDTTEIQRHIRDYYEKQSDSMAELKMYLALHFNPTCRKPFFRNTCEQRCCSRVFIAAFVIMKVGNSLSAHQ